jgi:hypothetical protein
MSKNISEIKKQLSLSIGNDNYKIDFSPNLLYIWKYNPVSDKLGFWVYVASSKIKNGKLGYNWERFIPLELAKFCTRTLANKAFW